MKQIISTSKAPKAIGPYSQAIKAGQTVYFSGQIGLDPQSMQLVAGGVAAQARQAFNNLKVIAEAAGGDLAAIAKLNVYLTDMEHYSDFNVVMQEVYQNSFPARAVVAVKGLPLGALVEMDAVMVVYS